MKGIMHMKIKKSITAAVVAVITVAAVAVRYIFLDKFVNPVTLFSDFGSPYTALCIGIAVAGILCFGVLFSMNKNALVLHRQAPNVASRVTSALFAAAFAAAFIYSVKELVSPTASFVMTSVALPILNIARAVQIVASVVSAVYFVYIAAGKCGKTAGLLSSFPPLWFAASILGFFISTASYVNIFGRALFVIAYSLCAFTLLYESRLTVYKNPVFTADGEIKNGENAERFVRLRTYTALCGTCLFCFAVKAIPEFIALKGGFAFRQSTPLYFIELAAALYFAVKAFSKYETEEK